MFNSIKSRKLSSVFAHLRGPLEMVRSRNPRKGMRLCWGNNGIGVEGRVRVRDVEWLYISLVITFRIIYNLLKYA